MKQHSPRFLALVQTAKTHVKEISPEVLKAKIDHKENFYLIDVREDNEWVTGSVPTAIHLSKGIIERDIEKQIADFNAEIVVFCSGGFRAALTAESLHKMGYTNVASLAGGLTAWTTANYPVVLETK